MVYHHSYIILFKFNFKILHNTKYDGFKLSLILFLFYINIIIDFPIIFIIILIFILPA